MCHAFKAFPQQAQRLLGDFCVITYIFLVAEAWASKPVSLIEVERTGELIWGRNVKEEKNHFAQSVR